MFSTHDLNPQRLCPKCHDYPLEPIILKHDKQSTNLQTMLVCSSFGCPYMMIDNQIPPQAPQNKTNVINDPLVTKFISESSPAPVSFLASPNGLPIGCFGVDSKNNSTSDLLFPSLLDLI